MDTPMTTRHDLRRDRTRSQLQDAMLELVLARGYDAIVVQEIADKADVGRGTFYFHFDHKEALLWSIVEDRFPIRNHAAAEVFDSAVPEQAEYFHYVNRFRQFEKNKAVFLAILGRRASQAVASRAHQVLVEEAIREMESFQLYRDLDQPAEITAQIVVGLTVRLAVWWLENNKPYTAMQMSVLLYQTLHHREPPAGVWEEGGPR